MSVSHNAAALVLRQIDTYREQAAVHMAQAQVWRVKGNRRNEKAETSKAVICDGMAEKELQAYRRARGIISNGEVMTNTIDIEIWLSTLTQEQKQAVCRAVAQDHGAAGQIASRAATTPEQRSKAATKAARARWSKKRQTTT